MFYENARTSDMSVQRRHKSRLAKHKLTPH